VEEVVIPYKPMTDEEDKKELYFSFPQVLIMNPKYKISHSAIVLYAILRNKRNLSKNNKDRYRDSDGIFVIFTRDQLSKLMNVNVSSVVKYFKELTQYGLVNEVRRGLGKANKIYFGSVDASNWSDELDNFNHETVETEDLDGGGKKS